MSRPRLIVANLDCESDYAATRHTRTPLPKPVLERIALLGTLLRVFASDQDQLWIPAPVTPQQLETVPGLPCPQLVGGCGYSEVQGHTGHAELLAWGQTEKLPVPEVDPRAAATDQPSDSASPLHRRLWRMPVASPATCARVHHRAFTLAVRQQLGCQLPGAREVTDLDKLLAHLHSAPPATGKWVVKSPWSAAGRQRVIATGHPDEKTRRRLQRLFKGSDSLVYEPWLDRQLDLGVCGLAGDTGVEILGIHRLEVDPRGQVTGITLPLDGAPVPGLGAHHESELQRLALGVGDALMREGYRGPFGVDAWVHDRDNVPTLCPIGEVNARLTFGFVARALAERLAATTGTLHLGLGGAPLTDGAIPLARARDGSLAAWAEISHR